MGLLLLVAAVVAVATLANNQEESPLLWGLLAFVFCIIGGVFGAMLGQLLGGLLVFGLMQFKIAKYG